MSSPLLKTYARGTHRLVSPETTLARISPHLRDFGIVRCADITGLDKIGIPVYVAIRPQGRTLQTANGKGLTHTDAKVSAYMEAIEHWHAENPAGSFRRACFAELVAERSGALSATRVVVQTRAAYAGDRRQFDWVKGKELFSNEPVWVPAFAVHFCRNLPYRGSSNGLASGNHPIEAALHALYEVIERDTLVGLSSNGKVAFERCQVIDCDTILDEAAGWLYERLRSAGTRLVLLRVPNALSVHTMTAFLLDPSSSSNATTVNFGAGAHLSPSVAAVRAITEAAQTRLTNIHGSREDLPEGAYRSGPAHETVFAYFSQLTANTQWRSLEDHSSDDLVTDYCAVLKDVRTLAEDIYAVDLSQGRAGVSAMKVLIPGTLVPGWL